MGSQWLAEVCETKKLNKKENVSYPNSFLSCSKDLTTENPDRSYKLTKDKNSNAFLKLRELKLENSKNIVKSHLNIKPSEINSLH